MIPSHARAAERAARRLHVNRLAALESARFEVLEHYRDHVSTKGWVCSRAAAEAFEAKEAERPYTFEAHPALDPVSPASARASS